MRGEVASQYSVQAVHSKRLCSLGVGLSVCLEKELATNFLFNNYDLFCKKKISIGRFVADE